MVTGDAVNVAARLQGAAEPGGILASERTARGARGFRFGEATNLDLKGKGAPVPAMELLEGAAAIQDRGVPGLHAPMVGRDEELVLVADDVPAFRGRGPAQPRHDLRRCRRREEPPHLRVPAAGGARRRHGDLAGAAFPTATASRTGRSRRSSRATPASSTPTRRSSRSRRSARRARAADGSRDRRSRARDRRPRLHGGRRDPESLRGRSTSRTCAQEVHAAGGRSSPRSRRGAARGGRRGHPLGRSARCSTCWRSWPERVEGPVLFLCPSRPDLAATRPGVGRRPAQRPRSRSIRCPPRRPTSWSDALLTVDDLPVSVHERILERAEGNPFFLEEIVRHLIDEGHRSCARRSLARERGDRGGRDPRHRPGRARRPVRSPRPDGQAGRSRRPPWSGAFLARVRCAAVRAAPDAATRSRSLEDRSSCSRARARPSRASPSSSSSTS